MTLATPPHSPRGRRIALLGIFGVGNLGNEASLAAALSGIRQALPEASIVCITTRPEQVTLAYQVEAWPLHEPHRASPSTSRWRKLVRRIFVRPFEVSGDWMRAWRRLRSVDKLLIPGTGILDDFGEPPEGLPYSLLKWCASARLAGCRLTFLSVGAGPIHHRRSRLWMRLAASLAHARSFRDNYSRDYMQRLGLDTSRDDVAPDIVFSLPIPPSLECPRPAGGTPVVVALGVMSYYGWENDPRVGQELFERYIQKICGLIAALLQSGCTVRIVTGAECDRHAIDAVLARLAPQPPGLVHVEPTRSMDDVMRTIGLAHVAVVTRFHNLVAALMLDRPVISIGYAEKNDALMSDFGMESLCMHIDTFDAHAAAALVSSVIADWDHIHEKVRSRRLACQARLGRQLQHALTA